MADSRLLLRGRALLLRVQRPADVPDMFTAECDDSNLLLGRFGGIAPDFGRYARPSDFDEFPLSVVHVSTSTLLGRIGFYDLSQRDQRCKIAVDLLGGRGRGFLLESAAIALRYALYGLGLRKVYFDVMEPNSSHFGGAERLGLSLEGTFVDYRRLGCEFVDMRVYSCTRESFDRALSNPRIAQLLVPPARAGLGGVK